MKPRAIGRLGWIALYGIGLAIYGTASLRVQSPGYMDADYYFAIGLQLANGQGLSEPFLWNYLDDPISLPHVANLYWMPLPSFIAASGIWLTGLGFRGAQIPFILLAAAIPPLGAYFCQQLSDDRRLAWMAGLFAALPGFFLPFLVTIDSFAIFAIVGGLALWLMALSVRDPSAWRWLLSGLLIGIGSLARADGLLLLGIGVIAVIWSRRKRVSSTAMLGLGFLAIMLPWWARNLSATGSIFNPGTQRLLWMLSYNDLFAYPASILTLDRWLEAGLQSAARVRVEAFVTNLQRLIAEGGIVFLVPFMGIGVARKWGHPFVRLGILYLGVLFVAMTIVFPFLGPRGALFHSMSAVMPMLWALAPIGLKAAIDWLGQRRNWDRQEAWRVLSTGAVVLAAVLTLGLFANRFYLAEDSWNASAQAYREVAEALPDRADLIVAVNNPPGFFAHSQISAVAIPNGTDQSLRDVVEAFNVSWVVLEANHPQGLDILYSSPDSVSWLRKHAEISSAGGQTVHVLEVVR